MQNIDLIGSSDLVQDTIFNAKFLGWLLNPKENHNLGYSFLEDFLFLIGKKLNKNSDIKIEISHKMNLSGVIDILIETNNSFYAIQCGGENRSVYEYENYIKSNLNPDKKVVSVRLGISPFHFSGKYEYIKCLMFSELAEIMPDNLTPKNQQSVNQFFNVIQEESVKTICTKYTDDDIKNWKDLNDKYGKTIRKIAKYFNLAITSVVFDTDERRYVIRADKNPFLIFICKDNYLTIQIRTSGTNAEEYFEKFSKITEQMGLKFLIDKPITILQEVVISDFDKKSVEDLTSAINESKILENFEKFFSIYD